MGTDGNGIVYPFRGIAQALRTHRQRWTLIYATLLALAACASAAALIESGYGLEEPAAVAALAVVAGVAERTAVRLTRSIELSLSFLPAVLAAVLFGPLASATVGAATMLGDPELISRRDPTRAPRLKWATYTSSRFIMGAATGLAAQAARGVISSDFGGIIAATLVAVVVSELLDIVFATLTTLVRAGSVLETAASLTPLLFIAPPAYAPIVAVLALMYVEVSPWTLALFLLPAMAAQRLYGLYQQERQLASELSFANETLERANLQFAAALIATLDARDRYTAGHSAAVAIYSRDIASRMGLPKEIQDKAYLCGLVHDIGKIGLPPGLLEKPGALTLDERRQMQEHSAIGEGILAHVDQYSEISVIVRFHHERIDGQGYPDGLVGEEIPLVSRIIAVADAYNAMTSDRPYRDAMPSRVARMRLAQAVDSQFDTAAVAAFEAVLAGAEEDYRLARRPDFLAFAHRSYHAEPEPDSVAEVA